MGTGEPARRGHALTRSAERPGNEKSAINALPRWRGAALLLLLTACGCLPEARGAAPSTPPTRTGQAPPLVIAVPYGLDAYVPVPANNPPTALKVELGRELFFDKRLSRDRRIACATCHDPRRAFSDGRTLARGVFGRSGRRNTPSLLNRAWGTSFSWDGRIPTLEQQVLAPIGNPSELGMTPEEVVERLGADPRSIQAFTAAVGKPPTVEGLAAALASYVRTIMSGNSPFDRYLMGDRDALGPQARLGLRLFRGRAGCSRCHVGANLTDEDFHNTGVAWRVPDRVAAPAEGTLADVGRFAVTGIERDRGAFKTPTLRNVAQSAPYMHDGSIRSLEEVIEFYDRGGVSNPWLDADLAPLHLTSDQKRALLALLEAFSGELRAGLGHLPRTPETNSGPPAPMSARRAQ